MTDDEIAEGLQRISDALNKKKKSARRAEKARDQRLPDPRIPTSQFVDRVRHKVRNMNDLSVDEVWEERNRLEKIKIGRALVQVGFEKYRGVLLNGVRKERWTRVRDEEGKLIPNARQIYRPRGSACICGAEPNVHCMFHGIGAAR